MYKTQLCINNGSPSAMEQIDVSLECSVLHFHNSLFKFFGMAPSKSCFTKSDSKLLSFKRNGINVVCLSVLFVVWLVSWFLLCLFCFWEG